MAEKTTTQRNFVFLQIFKGNLVERSKEPKQYFIETVIYDKDGTTPKGVTFLRRVSGLEQYYLRSVTYELKELSDGKEIERIKVQLQDCVDSTSWYQIELTYPSVVASNFMKVLPNIEFGQPLDLDVFPDKESGHAVLLWKHEGKVIRTAFTKDNPGELPDAVKLSTGKWNFVTQNDWLLSNTKTIAENLKEFWKQNAEMFETATPSRPATKPSNLPILSDDEELPSETVAKPAIRPTMTPQEQLSTFPAPSGDDDLPF